MKNAAVESQNEAEENAFDIRRGVPILVTGRNLVYIPGDLVTVSRTVDGAEAVLATLAPEECDYYHQSFAWPAELDGVAEGSELKFTFRLRGGDETASPVAVSKAVRVSSAETPPAPVVPEPTLTYCHSEEHTEDSERNVVFEGYGLEFVGTNLTGSTATATFQAGPEEEPTTLTVPANKLDVASQGLNAVIDGGWLADEILSSIDGGTAITFTFTTDGGTATLTAHKAE